MGRQAVGQGKSFGITPSELEVWSAGGDDSYVYTTNWRLMRALQRRFGEGAEYIRDGYTMAWQFRIPKRFIAFLKRAFRRMKRLERLA